MDDYDAFFKKMMAQLDGYQDISDLITDCEEQLNKLRNESNYHLNEYLENDFTESLANLKREHEHWRAVLLGLSHFGHTSSMKVKDIDKTIHLIRISSINQTMNSDLQSGINFIENKYSNLLADIRHRQALLMAGIGISLSIVLSLFT
ncbi:hypothetical protein [Gracilimonas sp.]|uniref:hypothetical protein n=1 Tax=Gracilimonas sp. TaxID=1974203 RepID=UPI0028715394|nr:hypothetical protein [Gracilimonas sp.]